MSAAWPFKNSGVTNTDHSGHCIVAAKLVNNFFWIGENVAHPFLILQAIWIYKPSLQIIWIIFYHFDLDSEKFTEGAFSKPNGWKTKNSLRTKVRG